MNINTKAIVRIYVQSIEYDWTTPFNKTDTFDSVGTGFFIDSEHIITCYHVVENSITNLITIPSLGKKKYNVEFVSCCPSLDIALLRTIDYKSKDFLEFDDSDQVKMTEEVYAVGYPLGQLNVKYSSGIISGIQDYLFQTDAPINNGNSGGPLINKNNKVIGINSSKIVSLNTEGIGMAIPINFFKTMYKLMLTNKIIRKPNIPFQFNDTSTDLWNYCVSNKNKVLIFNEFDSSTELTTSKKFTEGYFVKNTIVDAVKLNAKKTTQKTIEEIISKYNIVLKKKDLLLEFDGYAVDNYGEVKTSWSTEKISINNLILRYNINDKIKITYWSYTEKKIINCEFVLDYLFPIKSIVPLIEIPEYIIIGGIIIMNFSINHAETYKDIYKNIQDWFTFRIKPKVIISKILSGSSIKNDEIIEDGEIIVKINDIDVYSIDDIISEIINSIKRKDTYVILINDKNDTIAINIIDSLKETIQLSSVFNYKLMENKLFKTIIENRPT
jgi:S1-C subfamily serine protease